MRLKYPVFVFICLLFTLRCFAHPMPHSLLLLDVKQDGIAAKLSLPLKEFQLVFPQEDIDSNWRTLLQRKGPWLDAYLLKHLSIKDSTGKLWTITIEHKSVSENEQPLSGKYHELTYTLWLEAPTNSTSRHFTMHYDVIMHQLVTHKLFIRLNSDWYGGLTSKDSVDADLGVLMVNTGDGKIPPVIINLDEGSTWKGFKSMVALGIEHIAEGTDHLLFLFVLLLPATLIPENKRWKTFGGSKYSLFRLLKIVTAFTIGHSVSLLLGAMKILTLPSQPVEIAIAITIFITAIHALRPVFPGKETWVAISFGLIHGLAFSGVLSEMNLDGSRLAWSILGFNLGIEAMQLFVIVCTVPWLIILSKNHFYKGIRITGALFAMIASWGWMIERITLKPNPVTIWTEKLPSYYQYILLLLVIIAIISSFKKKANEV